MTQPQLEKVIQTTKKKMQKSAKELDFLEAARLRDEMFALEKMMKEQFGEEFLRCIIWNGTSLFSGRKIKQPSSLLFANTKLRFGIYETPSIFCNFANSMSNRQLNKKAKL